MNARDQFKDDLTGFFNEDDFAETIVYTPSGSTARDILAIVSESGDIGIQGDVPVYDRLSITIMATDATAPSYKDTFTIKNSSGEDVSWFVYSWMGGGHKSETWTFELARSSRS